MQALPADNAPTDIVSRKSEPREKQSFWGDELKASQKMLDKWQKQGVKIVRRYLDERGDGTAAVTESGDIFRLNLFHSNVKTLQDMGFENIAALDGGFNAWKKRGAVIEGQAEETKYHD